MVKNIYLRGFFFRLPQDTGSIQLMRLPILLKIIDRERELRTQGGKKIHTTGMR